MFLFLLANLAAILPQEVLDMSMLEGANVSLQVTPLVKKRPLDQGIKVIQSVFLLLVWFSPIGSNLAGIWAEHNDNLIIFWILYVSKILPRSIYMIDCLLLPYFACLILLSLLTFADIDNILCEFGAQKMKISVKFEFEFCL